MPHLILIRHSISRQQPDISSHTWTLTDEGKQRCEQLAEHLREYNIQHIYSSDEPKAHLTAQLVAEKLALPAVETHLGLRETWRDTAPYYESIDDFRAAVHQAMLEPEKLLFGEETFADAERRFADTLSELIAKHPDKTIAAATHGTVMSLYLARITNRDVYDIWLSLKMPAYAVLSLPELNLLTLVNKIDG